MKPSTFLVDPAAAEATTPPTTQRRPKMGVDCGFDVHPSLSPQCKDLYEAFLEEGIQKYRDALHPNTGELLIQIIGTPESKNAYVFFNVGEGPMLPYRSEYFLRFASKLVSRDNVMPYLKEV
ncbi:hypothetical protein S40293_10193 [Stachybotrys chartarum IBT 40293]|nr:hypothetical protein S40293_10193 [Stachybotrys chartarum IBT 40293]